MTEISLKDLRHDGEEWIDQSDIHALVDVAEAAHAYAHGRGSLARLRSRLARFKDFTAADEHEEGP